MRYSFKLNVSSFHFNIDISVYSKHFYVKSIQEKCHSLKIPLDKSFPKREQYPNAIEIIYFDKPGIWLILYKYIKKMKKKKKNLRNNRMEISNIKYVTINEIVSKTILSRHVI